jgi:hypothetical protein
LGLLAVERTDPLFLELFSKERVDRMAGFLEPGFSRLALLDIRKLVG